MEKLLRIIKRKEDCVLVQMIRTGIYKVIDIEQDTICMSENLDFATQIYESFDINRVRAEKEKLFNKWLEEVTEE